tara:strand:- start:169 stop:843 length:675 start_codon:yes stop_codon:yes gene_type:complete
MKKFIALLAVTFGVTAGTAVADPRVKGWNTHDSMGCMMMRECVENVIPITSIKDIENRYPNSDYTVVADHFDELISTLDLLGVKVFLGHKKYFVSSNRGVYYTVGNNFFLNSLYMSDPSTLISVMKHEGWHAAQDCMAGTIDNSMIAIIHNEEDVPWFWRNIATRTYPKSSLPWEQEALWAGNEKEKMTLTALKSCASKIPMWETYPPTPLTREFLEKKGYIKP